jgi:hypothetical protein
MIDVNREDLYRYKESKEVTKARLTEISDLGMEEVGIAQFGIKGVMSGLYIEMVWNVSDNQWKEYIDWVKKLINRNKKNQK